jgi:Peptidase inhibitor I9
MGFLGPRHWYARQTTGAHGTDHHRLILLGCRCARPGSRGEWASPPHLFNDDSAAPPEFDWPGAVPSLSLARHGAPVKSRRESGLMRPGIRLVGVVAVVISTLLAGCGSTPVTASRPTASSDGTVVATGSPGAIPCSYIVVFTDDAVSAAGVDPLIDSLAAKVGAKVNRRYHNVLKGFAGTMSEQAARQLAADPAVKSVEQDRVTSGGAVSGQPTPPSGSAVPSPGDCG